MKSKGVLVVGAGFLGTALAERLADDGTTVHLLSPHPVPGLTRNVNVHRGGMEDEMLVGELATSCDTIVHAASVSTPGSSATDPVIEGERNLLPTLHLLAVLQRHPGVHLIYLSSGGCVYGDSSRGAITELQRLTPKSYHGAGKVAAEAFLRAYSAVDPAKRATTILRPSNLYGPRQLLRDGFGLVRTMLEKMHTDTELEIWGDGGAVRDFIYIDDLIEVCARLVHLPLDNETYNIASGLPCSINDLIKVAERVCSATLRVRYSPERQTDVRATLLDSTKLRQALDWQPRISLEEGISRTWRWLTKK